MFKKILSLCLAVILFVTNTPSVFFADEGEVVSTEVSLDDIQIGDEIVVYENTETGEKVIMQVLPLKTARVDEGTGNWSGGSIPSDTYEFFFTYESAYYVEIGFRITFDGAKSKIID